MMFESFIALVRDIYQTDAFIQLHQPRFHGHEKAYLLDTIESTFVSSVGEYVNRFEMDIARFTGAKYAIATVNGTAALHVALLLAGVAAQTEVITQSLTFVATCNAIAYCQAEPVFVDIDHKSLGMSPEALAHFLSEQVDVRDGAAWNKKTGKRIAACVPMHTFGHPCDMPKIMAVCAQYHIPVVEDAAEALGSRLNAQSCGTFGRLGVLSFNGNKIITTGGGGMILTNDEALAKQAKHLTTTAKVPHPWQFEHNQIGFNYRMPNLNAAVGVAQLENLPLFLSVKRQIAKHYQEWGKVNGVPCMVEPALTHANYWLNALVLHDACQRDAFLQTTNQHGIMTRPVWEPMHCLPIYRHCMHGDLSVTKWAAERVVNVPSGVPLSLLT